MRNGTHMLKGIFVFITFEVEALDKTEKKNKKFNLLNKEILKAVPIL